MPAPPSGKPGAPTADFGDEAGTGPTQTWQVELGRPTCVSQVSSIWAASRIHQQGHSTDVASFTVQNSFSPLRTHSELTVDLDMHWNLVFQQRRERLTGRATSSEERTLSTRLEDAGTVFERRSTRGAPSRGLCSLAPSTHSCQTADGTSGTNRPHSYTGCESHGRLGSAYFNRDCRGFLMATLATQLPNVRRYQQAVLTGNGSFY